MDIKAIEEYVQAVRLAQKVAFWVFIMTEYMSDINCLKNS